MGACENIMLGQLPQSGKVATWTLTEDNPIIKPYDVTLWSGLTESRTGAIL
jgi:hypothetical protein